MGWLEEIRTMLRDERGAVLAVVGLACTLTSFSGMRLNTLDGIYPVEPSLVVRHLLACLAALGAAWVYGRRPSFVLSKNSRRVLFVACGFAVSLLLRYSQSLFITTSPALVVTGRLLEELFGVLLILVWAERIIPHGMRYALSCFGSALVLFGGFQILLTFFQRVPCMLVLVLLPLVSAATFGGYIKAEDPTMVVQHGDGALWPVDMARWPGRLLYLGILFGFIYIEGQILAPSLEIQQQSMASQLSIALGNSLAGLAVLVLVPRLSVMRAQPRLAFSLMFLAMFALATIAFSFMSYLNSTLVTVYLAMASVGSQFTMALVWAAPFSRLGPATTPYTAVALGYACSLLARTASTATMCIAQIYPTLPVGLVMGLVLAVTFGLCIACIVRLPEGEQPVAALQVDAAKPAPTPFKDVLATISQNSGLTQQESRVLALCAKGKNARYVAEELGVSMNTTKSHMRTLYAKLGVHSQQELIKLVDDAFGRRSTAPASQNERMQP